MKAWIGPVVGLSVLVSLPAMAQVRPTAPANPLQNLPQVQTPTGPKINTQVQSNTLNPRLAALLARQITPRRFDVHGAKAVPFKEVAALFTPMVGKNVRVGDIIDATKKVADVYKAHGYALSFAFVPTQDFTNGMVQIQVVEGYVADVQMKGNFGNMESKIRDIAQHMVNDRPLREATFERYLQVMGMLPGVKINANVPAPTTTDGATQLVLDVTRTRFNATSGIDLNHPGVQGLTGVTENGMLGQAEQVGVSTLLPSGPGDQRLYSLSYLQPLWSNGLQLKVTASHYQGDPDTDNQLPYYLTAFLHQNQYAFTFSYPLLLNNHTNISLSAGMYATSLDELYTNTITGLHLDQQYGLRVADTKLDIVQASTTQTRKIEVEVAHGIDALGASASTIVSLGNEAVMVRANPSFTRYNFSFTQANALPMKFGTAFSFAGQWSNDTLPSTEQISFGGPRFGLAYDPGEVAGDKGFGVSMEVNRHFDLGYEWLKQVTPYLIGQFARVYLNTGVESVSLLGTAGLGVRWTDNHHYSFDLTLAEPVGDVPIGAPHREPRIDFSFSYQLK